MARGFRCGAACRTCPSCACRLSDVLHNKTSVPVSRNCFRGFLEHNHSLENLKFDGGRDTAPHAGQAPAQEGPPAADVHDERDDIVVYVDPNPREDHDPRMRLSWSNSYQKQTSQLIVRSIEMCGQQVGERIEYGPRCYHCARGCRPQLDSIVGCSSSAPLWNGTNHIIE